jgi:DNA polymerase-3 subunit gamma/tau
MLARVTNPKAVRSATALVGAGLGLALALTLTACGSSGGSGGDKSAAGVASALRAAMSQAASSDGAGAPAESASSLAPASSGSSGSSGSDDATAGSDDATSGSDDATATSIPSLTGSDFCRSLSAASAQIATQLGSAMSSVAGTSASSPGDVSSIFATEKQLLTPLVAKAPAELAAPLQHLLGVVDSLAAMGSSLNDPSQLASLEQQTTQLSADSSQIEAYISSHCTVVH